MEKENLCEDYYVLLDYAWLASWLCISYSYCRYLEPPNPKLLPTTPAPSCTKRTKKTPKTTPTRTDSLAASTRRAYALTSPIHNLSPIPRRAVRSPTSPSRLRVLFFSWYGSSSFFSTLFAAQWPMVSRSSKAVSGDLPRSLLVGVLEMRGTP
jgi:hypothetical protein